MAEENFGPIAAITGFEDAEDAYARANASEHGLAAYVFTRDPKRMREGGREARIRHGGCEPYALAAAEAPFGASRQAAWAAKAAPKAYSTT